MDNSSLIYRLKEYFNRSKVHHIDAEMNHELNVGLKFGDIVKLCVHWGEYMAPAER